MNKNLVIVESPAKAATIQKYLGKDFEVAASYGHVRDLPKKGMSVDIQQGFEPTYEISPDKKKTVTELKKKAAGAVAVWLASDPDREGEAIAWHLCKALGLDPNSTHRIAFQEITEPGIKRAVENPRNVDQNLVDAQQARRVLDRLVGYELSPVLWKKVGPGLSAGRVQSVAVRLIVDREREIENFKSASSFKVTAYFDVEGAKLKAELAGRIQEEARANEMLEKLKPADYTVSALDKKPGKRSPSAPFTTSTLQQEASRKLGFSVRQTMSVAQKLYENGLITYMRTDSVNLSETALTAASEAIKKLYGSNYSMRRTYQNKSAGAQEAHEAIRPTDFGRVAASGDASAQRLYELIWQRATASQMADAKIEKTTAIITPSTTDEQFKADADAVVFDGFLKVYSESHDEDEDESELLPPLKVGQKLDLDEVIARQTFTKPKPRYTEASLVRKLEEEGIGRPSTYAPTISTIQDRDYVIKADVEGKTRSVIELKLSNGQVIKNQVDENYGFDRNKLIPTPVGELTTDFLVKFFPDIVDYDFTAEIENKFDAIASGKTKWNQMIKEFYQPFHKTVESAEDVSRMEASQVREIGTHPKTKKPIVARLGRYGPMLQMGEASDDEKPAFAPIPEGLKLSDITLDQALELFSLPRKLGATQKGEEIMANFGPFGPYVKAGTTTVSIRPDDPFSIQLDRAQELINAKRAEQANRIINDFGNGVQVLNGRFGPYISDGKKNAKIPKGEDPKAITKEAAEALLSQAPVRKPRKRVRKQ